MIIEFNQVSRQPNPCFEGKLNGKIVISGKGATRSNNCYVEYNNRRIDLSDKMHREKLNGKTVTQITDIFEAGQCIGRLYPGVVPLKKILVVSIGYGYYAFQFEGIDYIVYEVGLGADQHYFCVYKNSETVAIIKKEDMTINYCDRYTLYAFEYSYLLPLAVLTVYLDCFLYPHNGANTGTSYDDDSCYTCYKELREKYDPTFIPRVIQETIKCNN